MRESQEQDSRTVVERERPHPLAGTRPLESKRASHFVTSAKLSQTSDGVNAKSHDFAIESVCVPAGPGRVEMIMDEMRLAIARAPREQCAELAAAVWKAYAAGQIGDDDAQSLADAVEARKVVRTPAIARRRVGSRPRSPESIERRRRWVASGYLPPQIAARFTMGEGAALAVMAAEIAKQGRCRLTLGHIAAVAGVCKQTVRNAVRQAVGLGLVRSEEWRLSAFRSAPNTVTIVSAEWTAWLQLTGRVKKRVAHEESFIEGAGYLNASGTLRAFLRGEQAQRSVDRRGGSALGASVAGTRRWLETAKDFAHA